MSTCIKECDGILCVKSLQLLLLLFFVSHKVSHPFDNAEIDIIDMSLYKKINISFNFPFFL